MPIEQSDIVSALLAFSTDLLVGCLGSLIGAISCYFVAFKRALKEEKATSLIAKRADLYGTILELVTKLRLNNHLLFDDAYLSTLQSLAPQIDAFASDKVTEEFKCLLDRLLDRRSKFNSQRKEAWNFYFPITLEPDPDNPNELIESEYPRWDGATDAYDKELAGLRKKLLLSYEEINGLVDAISNAMRGDFSK